MPGGTLSGYRVASLSWKSFDALKIGTIYLLNFPVFTLRLMSEPLQWSVFFSIRARSEAQIKVELD